ncbi:MULTISPECIES: Tim44/TimA family putative adaptor protein [Hyphobacterium]|uniref:Tim44/TimA family putative adaptor protein n=1 Tax=Hyphobacterium vulgare TaxID=1736751 RepID=A0ABV6ZXL4_9PROT
MDVVTLLIAAGAALFFAIRLYQVLGRRTGHTPEPQPAPASDGPKAADSEAPMAPAFSGPAGNGLTAIAEADPRFDPVEFVAGARAAYTLIVEAFARGEKETLRPLLSDKVYARYAEAIDARLAKDEVTTTEIDRIAEAQITGADLAGKTARVKVHFQADIATETRDKDGQLVSGDLANKIDADEIWTFERPIDSRDPNWVLAGVRTN